MQITTTSTVAVVDKENAEENNDQTPDKNTNDTAATQKIRRKVGTREYNDQEIAIINRRNMELIQTLRTLDSAFSMGESGGLYIY